MAYTSIDDPTIYFTTNLRSGLYGGSNTAFNIGFQPDVIWNKKRNGTGVHSLFDSVRGFGASGKVLYPHTSDDEANNALIASVSSTGFTVTASSDDTGSMVDWCWKAGTSFSNDASATSVGTIDSTGSVSTDAGFSIVSYTGTGSAGTIKHGLSVAPSWVIIKNRDDGQSWRVGVTSVGFDKYFGLNGSGASTSSSGMFNNTAPTTSVFSVGNDGATNASGEKCIAYCFASVKGYSKIGNFTGNGNANGPYVHLGFRPAWIMFKPDSSADWTIVDNKRNTFNVVKDKTLNANLSSTEHDGSADLDFLSNGFKIRNANTDTNHTGTIVYFAFAESPFVNSNGIPCNAR